MLSEGTTEEIKDSILNAKMWTAFALHQAVVAALRREGFEVGVTCHYGGLQGYQLRGHLNWNNKTDLAVETCLGRVVREFSFTTFGWSNRQSTKLEFYAECGMFRD